MLQKILRLLLVSPTTAFVPVRDGRVTPLQPHPVKTQVAPQNLLSARSVVWAPVSAKRIGAAETVMVVGVMAYFAYGVASAIGLF